LAAGIPPNAQQVDPPPSPLSCRPALPTQIRKNEPIFKFVPPPSSFRKTSFRLFYLRSSHSSAAILSLFDLYLSVFICGQFSVTTFQKKSSVFFSTISRQFSPHRERPHSKMKAENYDFRPRNS
jgi:hypothetical protein